MKTKEDLIFSVIALEGTLKHEGLYEDTLRIMDEFAEQERSKNCTIHGVIQRFMNSEIKIKVDEPTKKHLLKHIFVECGFEVEENKYTFEKGRFFWVEGGLFSSEAKHLKNSMDLIRRNRSKETVNLSDLNVV